MKNLFIIAFAFIGLFTNAQEAYIIQHSTDAITKKEYYLPTENLVVANKEKTTGFSMTPNFRFEKGKVALKSLIVKSFVGSSCVEKSVLYILLENENLITLNAWNNFNCDGTSYFDFNQNDLKLLSESNAKLIRFVNGRDYAQFENTIEEDSKTFFIRVLTKSKIEEVK
jgi:hypothetical protein